MSRLTAASEFKNSMMYRKVTEVHGADGASIETGNGS